LLNDKNLVFFNKHILFKEWLWSDLKAILEEWTWYINSLELNKKERFRWISLKLEAETSHTNEDHSETELLKITTWLNRELYKKLVTILKKAMNSGNPEAFIKYTHLVNEAKKFGIK
jgi:hypothetical protein